MPNISLTSYIVLNAKRYIDDNWINGDDALALSRDEKVTLTSEDEYEIMPLSSEEKIKNLFLKHVASRVANFILIPVTFLCTTVDLTTGIVLGGVNLLTGGYFETIHRMACSNLLAGRYVISGVFQQSLETINPSAKLKPEVRRGLITHFVSDKLRSMGSKLADSETFFQKHVGSRILNLISIPIITLTLSVDLVIALIWTPFVLLTGGAIKDLEFINNLVFRGLNFPNLAYEMYGIIPTVINPNYWKEKCHI